MTEDQRYLIYRERLINDKDFSKIQFDNLKLILLSKIGELFVDMLLWALTKLFSWGRFLIWPIILMLEAKGYIKLSDGLLQILKEALK